MKNGWFRPLDDLWAKFKDEFSLDDIRRRRSRRIRSMESHMSFRTGQHDDVVLPGGRAEQSRQEPPKTIAEFSDLAKSLHCSDASRDDQLPEAGRCGDERGALVH